MKKSLEIYMLVLGALIAIAVVYKAFTGPKTVTIDSAHFACTQTEPHDIDARCTQYTWRVGAR